jgi:hypothetical protein
MSVMNDEKAIDRMLKRSLGARSAGVESGACLDADTLAAWSEGTLQGSERAAAEAHAADCARCLAVLAALVTTTPVAARQPWWRITLSVRWLAPVTALAAAVVLWVAVDPRFARRETAEPVTAQDAVAPSKPKQEAAPPTSSPVAEAPAERPSLQKRATPASPAPTASTEALEERRDAAASAPQRYAAAEEKARPPATAADAPAAPSPLREEVSQRLRRQNDQVAPRLEIRSPDLAVRWRVVDASVEKSTDGGRSWERQQTGAAAAILAGVAPSADVCWLVGRQGTVIVTTDGRTWRQLTAPTSSDLLSVTAEGALTAAVRTAEGATYRTTDGGMTWVLQETP